MCEGGLSIEPMQSPQLCCLKALKTRWVVTAEGTWTRAVGFPAWPMSAACTAVHGDPSWTVGSRKGSWPSGTQRPPWQICRPHIRKQGPASLQPDVVDDGGMQWQGSPDTARALNASLFYLRCDDHAISVEPAPVFRTCLNRKVVGPRLAGASDGADPEMHFRELRATRSPHETIS